MTDFPAAQPHGPIETLFPDVFLVRGTFRGGPLVHIPRNMVVVREGRALTIVNSVRLSAEGERSLALLGDVKHVVKLGAAHGLDDPYYRATFAPTFWAPVPADAATKALVDGERGPLERATAFCFRRDARGEAALVVEQDAGNLLVTCDSVQSWESTEGCSTLGGLLIRAMGFLQPATIGPIWLKRATGGKPAEMSRDFARLIERDFRHLVAGHGVLLRDHAKAAIERSWARASGTRR